MKSTKTSDGQLLSYQNVGNVGNVILLISTCVVTACLLYRWPNEALFDENWLTHGFCVSNPDSTWWNSHTLSFYTDTLLALVTACLFFYYDSKKSGVLLSPIHRAALQGSIVSVFGHGCSHLFLGIVDPTEMDLRIRFDDLTGSIPYQLVSFGGLSSIFMGTMPLASTTKILATGIFGSLGFTVLNVGPSMNFVYAQGIIFVSSALNMLFLPTKYKDAAMYSIYPYVNLPVLVMGVLESTKCETMIKPIGGHAAYDASIVIGIILQGILSVHLEGSKGGSLRTKKIV